MKVQFVSVLAAIALSGCIVIPGKNSTEQPGKSYSARAIEFKPSDRVNLIETQGQVICEPSKPCTELNFDWKAQPNGRYRVYTHLFYPQKYEIQRVVFTADGRNYPFTASNQTAARTVLNSELINSTNFIEVPFSFIEILNRAKTIDLAVETDQGPITHSMLTEEKQSYAYLTFKRGYNKLAETQKK